MWSQGEEILGIVLLCAGYALLRIFLKNKVPERTNRPGTGFIGDRLRRSEFYFERLSVGIYDVKSGYEGEARLIAAGIGIGRQ